MTLDARRQRFLARMAILLLIIGIVPFIASSARASTTFVDEGHIQFSNIFGISTTETEWLITCPELPGSQGDDAHIFTLPADLETAGTTTTASGVSPATYDLDLVFYGDDCASTGSSFEVGTNETAPTPEGTRYVLVTAFEGSDIAVTLQVGPNGGGPTPTPTETTPTESPSPTATPTSGTGSRGTYPLEPNDPLFPPDPDLPEILGGQWGMRKVKAPEAWQESRSTGFGIKVAVLDTGLDLDHPDFNCPGKVEVVANSDFIGDGNGPQDGQGHGTHVAGIIGACTNNGEGVVGMAPDATIMPIQVLNAAGEGNVTETLPGAIRSAADNGAHVINMSIGTFPVNTPIDVLLGDVFPEVDAAVEYAVSKGVVVVAAAGNETFPLCSYPAIVEDIVCVGSTDNRDLNSYFGNFPVNDDDEDVLGAGLIAPGGSGQVFCDAHAENIVSTYLVENDDCNEGHVGYRGLDGTSMASPHVAGAAALVYDRLAGERSALNGATVVDALTSSADDLYAPGYDPASGYGRLNALEAVRAVTPVPDPDPSPTATTSPSPSPTVLEPQDTAVVFSDSVPASGQFSDEIGLQARLTDEAGEPLSGQTLTFQLLGEDSFLETSATTDSNGLAGQNLTLEAPPGSYELSVGYSGQTAAYNSSSSSKAFSLLRENSSSVLEVTGKGSKKALTATLTDSDNANSAIANAVVGFYADNEQVGAATTGPNGVASMDVPSGSKSNKTTYEARFSGDEFFTSSSASSK